MWYKTKSFISGIKLSLKGLQNNLVSSTFWKSYNFSVLYISTIYIRETKKNRINKHSSPPAFLKKCSCEEAPHRCREKKIKKDFTFKNKGV